MNKYLIITLGMIVGTLIFGLIVWFATEYLIVTSINNFLI
jgi:hypothetical protein